MDFEKTIAKAEELARDSKTVSISFLKIELGTGLTFAKLAQDSEIGSANRDRNQANARKAYDTIMQWHRRHSASDAVGIDMQELEPELTELRSVLQELGEDVN